MPALRELQLQFKQILKNPDLNMDCQIMDNALPAQDQLQIYRNNHYVNLSTSLKNIFPSLVKLLSTDCFVAIAKEYIKHTPSRHGNLQSYGYSLAEFLATFPTLDAYPYLGDVANLEWARHEAFHGPDQPGCDFKNLALIDPDHFVNIKFHLHSNCHLLACRFPALFIWQLCQEDQADEGMVLPDEGEKIIIWRENFQVQMKKISDAEFAWLSALKQHKTLIGAYQDALAISNNFELMSFLTQSMQRKWIINFEL